MIVSHGNFAALTRGLLASLVLAWLATAAAAQAPVEKVRVWLSSGVVRLGDRVALMVAVEDARASEIRALPQVKGLVLGPLPGPSEQISMQIFNGRQTSSVSRTWAIPVRPSEVGQYVIPPFEVVVDGTAVRSAELALNVVKDMKGEELGFFEMRASSTKVIVGQPFSLELVFGFDKALTASTEYHSLALSWWGRLPGLLENATAASTGGERRRILLNGREQIEIELLEPRTIRGRPFITLRLQRSFTPTRTGTLEIPTSFFEFGEIVQRGGLFTNFQKGQTYFARAPQLALDIVPLPETGQPLDFSGAIGTFAVRAEATPRDVDAGESIKFRVDWTGAGNLEFFTPPDPARLPAFRDFRVYGKTEQKSFDRRTVEYDLAPITSSAKEIPALPLSIYDPERERYTTLSTAPLPIRVRALDGAAALAADAQAERFAQDIRDVVLHPAPRDTSAPVGTATVLGVLAAVPACWLALRAFARRRFDPDAPAERARRRARKQLARQLSKATNAREYLDVLYTFLAARSGETREAWIGRRLREPLQGEADKLRALDTVIAELEATAWGGRASNVARERVLQAADEAVRGGL